MLLQVLLVGCFLATCEVRGEHLDIDFNRLRVVPETHSRTKEASNTRRRSLSSSYSRNNDHGDNSSGVHSGPETSIRRHANSIEATPDHNKGKVYKPREDPRQYYQSKSYLRSALEKEDLVSRQMSGVYPEMVTRLFAGQTVNRSPELRNFERTGRYREWNSLSDSDEDICVKCPVERTLVARPGTDKVLLQAPILKSCSGDKAPPGVHFVRLYGPTFGSLLEAGSHVIVGKMMYKGQYLKDCRFHVHVVTQLCQVPQHLTSRCISTRCNFTCSNRMLELVGSSSLECGSDLQWKGTVPVCRVRTWCQPPPLPANGQLSCQSAPTTDGQGVVEGSRCRAHCRPGWRATPRGAAVCRRGLWTHALACKRNRHRRQERGHR